jgi:uncharacterized membrane-anchored protein YhcB (DUF1043 family)
MDVAGILTACAPVLVALVGIIPTVISNRKKTQETLEQNRKETKEQLDRVQRTLDTHIKEDEDDKARNQRYRILRFYDEMCEHRRHSESHFEDILDDIDDYEEYCNRHPDFRNSRGHIAMKNIQSTYDHLKQTNGFLTHERDKEE